MFLRFVSAHIYNALDVVWTLLSHWSLGRFPKLPDRNQSCSHAGGSTETKPVVEVIVNKPPSLFALLIGINKYKSDDFENLDGAVADAAAVKSYLETSLGIPETQITTLFNEEATRDAIISCLQGLKNDPNIRTGDAILIFYAGHGSTAEAPSGWDAGGPEIQLLVSHDSLCDEDGNTILGLPDRTIGVLLEEIAQRKGDNITVIFDCCHSGSLTRDPFHPTRRVRGVKMPIKIPPDLDRNIWGGHRSTSIASGFLRTGLRSHVLLAACGAEENAKEELGRGYFTKRLLDTLEAVGADKVTYADLVQQIPSLPWQNPQCEGHNQDRICFDSKAPVRSNRVYPVRKFGQQYIMEVGTAHGITDGTVFSVYNERNFMPTQSPVATLTAAKSKAFTTVLAAPSGDSQLGINDQAYALLIRAGKQEDLRIHVQLDGKLMVVFEVLADEMQIDDPTKPKIVLVEKDRAELDIACENNHVVFNILDPLVTVHGLNRMPFRVNPSVEAIRPVLYKAAHFFWHLRRTGNAKVLQSKVDIEFMRLGEFEEEYDNNFKPVRKPSGPNLVKEGAADIVVDDKAIYGIKVTNKMGRPLYASLFYFDNSDLSISSYYQPPTSSGKVDPPLLPYGNITIGYGAGGGSPFKYSLWDGQDIDVGFLKLFISTEQVDLTCVPQISPFNKGNRGVSPFKPKTPGLWHTNLLTVIQRKKC